MTNEQAHAIAAELAEMRRQRDAALAAAQWHPIETAQEMEWVLVRYGQFEGICDVLRYVDGFWLDDDGNECEVPTHWMPLPAPPEAV